MSASLRKPLKEQKTIKQNVVWNSFYFEIVGERKMKRISQGKQQEWRRMIARLSAIPPLQPPWPESLRSPSEFSTITTCQLHCRVGDECLLQAPLDTRCTATAHLPEGSPAPQTQTFHFQACAWSTGGTHTVRLLTLYQRVRLQNGHNSYPRNRLECTWNS